MRRRLSGLPVCVPDKIKDEMRALKATGMTAGQVAAEVERRHGIRPSRANTNVICRGIAPQKRGPRSKAEQAAAPERGRAASRKAQERGELNSAICSDITGLIRSLHQGYRERLLGIRAELIKARACLMEERYEKSHDEQMQEDQGER